jgi:Phage tail lysozyme
VTTEKQVYDALIAARFNRSQAAGIMGNLEAESGFNPEAVNPGGPSAGVGEAQWETTFYPQARGFVTGNPVRDLERQVAEIVRDARGLNLTGSAQQVAGTWAADFEKCAGCQPGGSQYMQRQANAGRIYEQAKTGNWPAPGGPGITGGSGGGGSSSATGATAAQLTAFLSAPSGVLKDAGALVHGSAVVLDRVFGLFAPGQGWRITFGAAAVVLLFLSYRAFGAG